ncbi:ankyrin repeat domain-containing protein 53 isoform X1 [Hippoglossus stenolepis]|uniref:ankyrin repeat domain-containing protein 53 isoform X1 n=1 Tax=Hippoglossus stenolepis TaxID=195615 RepID=UPI00159C8471|nr:ankyrin repeat domain-containing protein 53 isoform X1 [Hippoglossus stenolepis]
MEPDKKHGKRGGKSRKLADRSPRDRRLFPAAARGRSQELDLSDSTQGLSELHMACLYGQLAPLERLMRSMLDRLDNGDPLGRRPVHLVMSSSNFHNAAACLRCLMENEADIHLTTDSGLTPLHLAAAEGLLDCVEILVQADADVMAQDDMGHTALDLARVWSHRDVGRYLRSCMWKAEKKKEMKEMAQARILYRDLVAEAKLNVIDKTSLIDKKMKEWAALKGIPHIKAVSPKVMASKYHTKCLLSNQDGSYVGTHKPTLSESSSGPDLQDIVTLWRDSGSRGRPQYNTKWDSTPRDAPDLPLDVLKSVLFPRVLPSRLNSPQDFNPRDIKEVPHRRCPRGWSPSPFY